MTKILVQYVGVAVAGSLLLIAAFGLAGTQPRPLWFVATALAVGFAAVAIRLVFPQVLESSWPARYDERLAALRTKSNDNRTQFLATWIQEADRERGEGAQTYVRRIRPLLLELATDRLVHRHGIDPRNEPDRARALLGDPVWALIAGSEPRAASFAEIEQAVQTIEKL